MLRSTERSVHINDPCNITTVKIHIKTFEKGWRKVCEIGILTVLSRVVFQYEIIPNPSQTSPPLDLFVENEGLSNSLKTVYQGMAD